MESQQVLLCGKDLCAISEHLRRLKDKIKLADVKRMLRRATEIHLRKDLIENYVDNFFRTEAEKIISKKVNNSATTINRLEWKAGKKAMNPDFKSVQTRSSE